MSGKDIASSILLAGLLLVPGGAAGWEQSESDLGYPLHWTESCYHYSINAAGSDDVGFEELTDIVREAFDSWQDVDCAYFHFLATAPATVAAQEFNEDQGNVNLLVWRETEEDWPYGPLVVGLTSVHYDPATGRIQDADIELNGYDFEFGALDDYPLDSPLIDLRSTLTHEIGHSIGLAHTDQEGATMSPLAEPGTTDKRSLTQDDIDGACALYPLDDDPEICEEPWCGLDLDGDSTTCEPSGGDAEEDCGCRAVGARGISAGSLPGLLGELLL